MHVSKAALATLTYAFTSDDADGYTVEIEDDLLKIKLNIDLEPAAQFERFIDTNGEILRWDEDNGEMIEASPSPLLGSYTVSGETVPHYFYY